MNLQNLPKTGLMKIVTNLVLVLYNGEVEVMKNFLLVVLVIVFGAGGTKAQIFPITPAEGYDQYRGGIAHGAVSNVSYFSSVANRNLEMFVYTPPGYNLNQKYSVIYCYQGIGVGPDTIFADWCCGAAILCDNLISEGRIQPVIIVALDDQFDGDYSNVNDMTIIDAIPYVDSNYSTYADADHRGLYGYSWGGGYTFNVGCANLDTFHYLSPTAAAPNKAGDSSLFPNGGIEARQKLKCLFISWGQWDYESIASSNVACHNFCVSNNIPHFWWEVPDEGHAAGVWRPALWNFLLMTEEAGISNPPVPRSAFSQIEAEEYSMQSGTQIEDCIEGGQNIGYIENEDYLLFKYIDFGDSAAYFEARVASATDGGNIELHLNSETGPIIGSCMVSGTGGWQAWETVSCDLSRVEGIHDVYLKFTGEDGYLFNLNWWKVREEIPDSPEGFSALLVSVNEIELAWTAPFGASSYNLWRCLTSGGPYEIIAPGITSTSYTDGGLEEFTAYYYVVSAFNTAGESEISEEVFAVTPNVSPAIPSGLAAIAEDGSVALSWDANNESDLSGYNIYRSTASDNKYTLLNNSILLNTHYIDYDVDNYSLYFYVITAVDVQMSESAYSVEVNAMPADRPVIQLSVEGFENGMSEWNNISGEDVVDWTQGAGSTVTPNTGPSGGANDSNWYLYLETSPGNANKSGDTAIVESQLIAGYGRIMTFYYHLYGSEIGSLYVDVFDGAWHNGIWNISGQQQSSSEDSYYQATVDLTGYTGLIKIRFRAVAAGGPRGDIAIDDIVISGVNVYGDTNDDNIVDIKDLPDFVNSWLKEDRYLDMDNDNKITLFELSKFAANWLSHSFQ